MARTFHLVETLGQGAFGVVHLARVADDDGFVQQLAVKMLHSHFSSDTELARRLRDEARLLALLEHDHIVRVHGLTRIDGRLAILMEPVRGADLSACEGECLPVRVALEVVEAVVSALLAAWQTVPLGQTEPLRVVHRDIKPSNIMVTERGGVKVMDFGVARARFDQREASTKSQQFGTASYMAPERWLEGVAEAPSDIFSLGVTLLELLGGKPLARPRLSRASFDEDIGVAASVVESAELRALVVQMCSFAPEERPDGNEVIARCRALCEVFPAPSLREWAETWVPRHRGSGAHSEDTRLVEDGSGETFVADLPAPTGTAPLPTAAAPVPAPSVEPVGVPSSTTGGRRGFFVGIALAVLLGVGWVNRDWLGWPSAADGPDIEAPVIGVPVPQVPAMDVSTVVVPAADAPDEEPLPAVVPEPPPAPVPVALVAPAPVSVPRPVPRAPPPPPEPVEALSTVTFALSPPGLDASTSSGPILHRTAARLTRGIHEVRVKGESGNWQCTVRIDGATGAWRVDDLSHQCTRIQ